MHELVALCQVCNEPLSVGKYNIYCLPGMQIRHYITWDTASIDASLRCSKCNTLLARAVALVVEEEKKEEPLDKACSK